VDHEAELAQLPDQKAVLERFARIEPPCEVFSRAVHRELLLKDVSALPLGKKQAKGVARLAREFLRDESSNATLPGLAQKLRFLVTYLSTVYDGENREALRQKAEALAKDLEAGREQVRTEGAQRAAAGTGETLEARAPELQLWARVSASLGAILQETQL
jgi:hypothetical protein